MIKEYFRSGINQIENQDKSGKLIKMDGWHIDTVTKCHWHFTGLLCLVLPVSSAEMFFPHDVASRSCITPSQLHIQCSHTELTCQTSMIGWFKTLTSNFSHYKSAYYTENHCTRYQSESSYVIWLMTSTDNMQILQSGAHAPLLGSKDIIPILIKALPHCNRCVVSHGILVSAPNQHTTGNRLTNFMWLYFIV